MDHNAPPEKNSVRQFNSVIRHNQSGAVLEENTGGARQKVDDLF